MRYLLINALPNGWSGIFAAIPFAIWFFLGIEGVANVAEETINPQRNILIGFGSAILTLVFLCLTTGIFATGVAGWEAIVYSAPGAAPSDSPLPLALGKIVAADSILFHLLVSIGLLGLVASFHGIILAAGRASFEFGRVGFAPRILGTIHKKFKTPAIALSVNMLIGIAALNLYIISMISVFVLRKNKPDLPRPFRVPLYPWTPAIALIIAAICMIAIAIYNPMLF